ncbi:MAG: pilus assembly protein PilP [Desulfobacteraceae bacterium]|nr:pilus assembly protein PilP [Desulfobacteraceae bacterium]
MDKRIKIILRRMIPAVCLVFFIGLAYGEPSKKLAEPVYKEMRPTKTPFDPDKIPDPFLSYLVKRGQQASAKAEDERRKKLEAEKDLKQQKLSAEERLKRQKLAAAERLKALKEAKTELQKVSLSQLTLTAIVKAPDGAWAMVRDKSGRGFVLKKGTYIGTNGGVVSKIAITEKKIIIKEPYLEKDLHIKYKPVEMELPDRVYE